MARAPAARKATTAENLQATLNNPNVRKFLDMLSAMEDTTTHGYNTTFGGGRVESLDRHPNLQREFKQTDGSTNSSGAAGRYQFLDKTWRTLQQQYPDQMPDFGERSQDFGAVALIAGRGALQDVVNGRFGTAVRKVGNIWASLPTSPYKQPKKSWDDVNKALGLQVPATGSNGSAANAQALTPEQGKRLYDVYKAGRMSPEQRADYERDFATIQKPAGATMLRSAVAPVGGSGGSGGAPVAPAQAAQATAKAAPYVLPVEIIMAYNDGSMNPQQRAEFERDYKAGVIAAPRHIPFELKGAQPEQGYLGRVGDSLSNLGSAMGKEGGGGSMLGLAEGVAALGSGLFGQVVGGVAALPDLATGSLTGRTGADAAATVKLAQDTFTYQPRTATGQASLGVMNTAVGEPFLAAQEGLGGAVYSTTGGALQLAQRAGLPISQQTIDETAARNAALTEGGFAALTTVLNPATPVRAAANLVRGRPAAPVMPPPIDATPVAPTATPFSTPAPAATARPAPRPQAPAAPLATNPADLAAQAEAMPRPATPQPTARPILSGTDKPFSFESVANLSLENRGLQATHEVRPFQDGYAIFPKAVAPRPTATGRTELAPENPTVTIQPDGAPPRPAPISDPITDAAPTNQPIQAPVGSVTTVGEGGLNVMHGSTRADLTADQVKIINPASKQGKKGRVYGGFYTTPDAVVAERYANMGAEGSTPTVYDVQIKQGAQVLNKEGDITRLSESYINEQRAAGVDVIAGKDPRGQVEYAIINPEAVGSLTPRAKPAAPKTAQGKAFTTSNKPVAFEYDVVPIESVVKSTNADLTPNAAARPELQPRNRDTDASTAQINKIANELNPELLAESPTFSMGAPVVLGSDAVAGHGRLAAIERRYAQGAGAEYRAFVAQKAAELGVDPARLAGVERPVLVRRVKDEADALTIAQDSNAPTTLRMSPAEQARIDAPNLPDLDKLARGADGEMNIPASYDFVRDFMGKLPVAERGDLMTPDGRISQAAVRRIQAAVSQKAYKDPDLIARFTESMGDEGKRISAALQKQAGAVAALAEAAAKGERYPTTLGADLAQAANKYADIKAAGSTVREYLDQGQLVDDGLSVGAREALEVMGENAKSGRAIGEYIQGKIAEVEAKGSPMQDSLFQANKPQAAAIGERIAEQVKAAGRSADEATQAGKLAEAYYAATAKALGLTPDEVFAQVGLSVERGNVGGANAALRLGEREHSMVFGENANASSFVHEAGHHFLESHAKLADQSPKLQADVDAVMTWAGHDGRKWSDLSASQKREVHEKFAESFEQYLLTGKAPTKGLKGVFADFKAWLTDVYTSLTEFAATNPRADLSPEVMAVMDRILGGGKAERAANAARGKNRKKSAPITPELLDFKRSAPVSGGVSPALHQARYDVLRDIGLTDEQIRGGSVEGDIKRLEWDAELAKYDTDYGVKMKEQLELERQKLREYGDGVVDSMGGTAKATPETRGAAIVRPLEAYQAWYRDKIKAFYKQADEQGAMTGGIELRGLENKLKENSAFYNDALLSMRKSLKSFMFEQRLLDDRGNPKPMSAKQAEMVRKHLNSIRTFETSRVIGELNTLIDDAVFSTLNRSVYGEARAVNAQYHRIFSDPKGIARLLDVDGINRKISHEKVAANVAALAETDAAQFRHIMKQLEEMPTPELQKMGNQAIGEIRAQIAEKITAYDSTKPETVAAIGKALAPYRGDKLREIFGEKGAQKLETFVAAHGILRKVDAQPSGTASMLRNIATKGSEVGMTGMGTAAGGAMAGPAGAAAGAVIGQQIGAKIKGAIAQAVDKKSFGKAMSPRQLETMRQSYDASGRRLAALPETEAATAAAQAAPDSTRARVTNGRLERSKEWIAFYAKLTDEQKAAVKKIGAAAWLLSVGGSGDNQANDDGENR